MQPANVAVRRWTDEKLDMRLRALEALPAHAWTSNDHYAAIEYIMQLYYPRTEPLLQHDWDAAMVTMRRQIDANLQAATDGTSPPSDFEEVNRRYQEFREQLHRSYEMSLADFRRIVMPALERYPFANGLVVSAGDVENLWRASASIHADSPPASKHARSDAHDRLIGRVGDAVIEAASALRGTYEILRRAHKCGCKDVKLFVSHRCGCLNDLLNDRTVSVADLLEGFEAGAPQIPPPRTPCSVSESPTVCRVSLMPIEPLMSRPSDDSSFSEWLEANLRPSRLPLDRDWGVKLEARVKQRLNSAD